MLDAVIEYSFDGIYITDGDARTIKINNAYESITGLKKEELLGRNMKELTDQGIISASGSLMAIETKKPVTLFQEFRTGKKALITSSPVLDKNGDVIMIARQGNLAMKKELAKAIAKIEE